VDHTGSDTVAAQISDILSRTVDFKSSGEWQGEHLADKSALPMLALSALTLPLLGPGSAVAILNAYFGYNLRLISPISVLNFLSIASQEGILVKDGKALEVLSQVDTIVFDKTGTLTLEQPHIGQIYTWHDIAADEILAYAAAAESKQTHPIARAIRQEATSRELLVPEIDQASYEVGYGVKTSVADRFIRVGSSRFMEMEGLAIPSQASATQTYCHEHGYALVYVAIGDQLVGGIELHATIRPEAKRVISDLQQRHMAVYIISGDHEKPTQQLAQELAVDHYFAETLPEQKAELIAQLQHEGRSVCFVGDGINDAIALTTADVSISLSGASALAIDAAQIILLDARLDQVTRLFELAKHLDANMKSNLITTVIPGVACIGGVYLLKFGVIATEVLYNLGLVAGVTNAMLPALKYERQQLEPHTA
jgi:Cu2+-exporting ATPase